MIIVQTEVLDIPSGGKDTEKECRGPFLTWSEAKAWAFDWEQDHALGLAKVYTVQEP